MDTAVHDRGSMTCMHTPGVVSPSSLLTMTSQQNHVHRLGPRVINRLHSNENKKGITHGTATCCAVYRKLPFWERRRRILSFIFTGSFWTSLLWGLTRSNIKLSLSVWEGHRVNTAAFRGLHSNYRLSYSQGAAHGYLWIIMILVIIILATIFMNAF